jgi:peptidoglycan/LPS O-acetylase OafA/YrhL
MKSTTTKHNILGLDALRGILAIIVCMSHSWQVFIDPLEHELTSWNYVFGISARFSVIGFYCLSGYVIALSIQRNIAKFEGFSGIEYFLARAFRILPPLIFVIASVYALTGIAAHYNIDRLPEGFRSTREIYFVDIKTQLLSLRTLLTDGNLSGVLNGPLWSLQYEIQLYIITGLAAISLFSTRSWIIRILAVGALYIYFHHAFRLRSANGTLTLQFLWYLIFWLGMAAFLFTMRLTKVKCWTVATIGMLCCFLLMATYDSRKLLDDMDSAKALIWAQFFFAAGSSALIVLLARTKSFSQFASLGNFSYTLYISHFPLLLFSYFLIVNTLPRYSMATGWIIAIAATGVCIFISKSTSKIIENSSSQRALLTSLTQSLKSAYLGFTFK